ncbi:MAG: sigma-54-dependent Fis family transcriptional regulator [Thermoanaerobaculaceae bacterium]|nr:sigma-54-dependent Fis family transcriptional regulator [Thermoanaerobaculaceae bacterium]
MSKKFTVLVVEDRSSLLRTFKENLESAGFSVLSASDGYEGRKLVESGGYDIAVFDYKMAGLNGIELLKLSKEIYPATPVILMTAFGSVESAVEAMKSGAYDFITKPVDMEHLIHIVSNALESSRMERVGLALKEDFERHSPFLGIVGTSTAIKNALIEIKKVAPLDSTVLLVGETGTGKELFARAIHSLSPRKENPFVAVNCAAIPSTLLENELFGHEKGAYTGAYESRLGRFELAHRGTLFLDEIGEMHIDLQAKLLRVIEEKRFTRVGSPVSVAVDVRLICATNRTLEDLENSGVFRKDLFYRISSFPIILPPLRERREDIPLLAEHILSKWRRELHNPKLTLTPAAIEYLKNQNWRGNVRELFNRIERAAILAQKDEIDADDLKGRAKDEDLLEQFLGIEDPEAWIKEETKWRVKEILKKCQGDKKRAASTLGIPASKIDEIIK